MFSDAAMPAQIRPKQAGISQSGRTMNGYSNHSHIHVALWSRSQAGPPRSSITKPCRKVRPGGVSMPIATADTRSSAAKTAKIRATIT